MEVFEGRSVPNRPGGLPPGVVSKIVAGIVIVIVLMVGMSMFYTVQEHEKAAILTFGKYSGETEAGLHFKLPYPIQQVIVLPAKKTQRIQIGFRETNGKVNPVEEESLMITGDENILSADAVVEWNISNMQNYLYNIDEAELFLRNSASAAIRSVIGSTSLDFAITEGKTEVQGKVKERLIEMQAKYETGIHILDLKFQDIEPPAGDVQTAFKDVTNAREEKSTKINVAMKYENDILPRERGNAQALIENAEAQKKSRILNAQGDVAKFNAIHTEYVNNKSVTESRLVIETLEKILPSAKIFISDSSGETVKYLPINELLRNPASGQTQGGAAK
ncbi:MULTISPECIES: FtsH protease activity modulator HflK [unclassified Paenibacillus]|uniref:FtsH protease activity modulator HflK n=1 Tax=unclassified Paenibacillus TaxID=185978 RepID=UPI0027816E9F|nr:MULTISPECIES: FtsH protease activity modulator HflK [unclassified Paenibacillus]MDQ0903766.1 membrane protease subunit HflK [Paenibacillus sp. V4I7]MDQ0917760.1 membrane protease subunit HflK [Paenibacillus sp. V4I5]